MQLSFVIGQTLQIENVITTQICLNKDSFYVRLVAHNIPKEEQHSFAHFVDWMPWNKITMIGYKTKVVGQLQKIMAFFMALCWAYYWETNKNV